MILSKIKTFFLMPVKHKIFFILNFILCGFARMAINILTLKQLSGYFGQFQKTLIICTVLNKKQYQKARFIGQSVRLAAKYTPWDSSCLTQAMVAKFWCWFYRIPYILYIGVKLSYDEKSGYAAHAWITAGPVAITGGQSFLEYHVLSSYVNKSKENTKKFFKHKSLCKEVL